MNSDRIKEIQETTAYPKSVSVMLALNQVWNECEQEKEKNCSIPATDVSSSSATRTIRMQQGLTQFEYTLPEDDAMMIMFILKRNKIWFADVTR